MDFTCKIYMGPKAHLPGEVLNEWIIKKIENLYPKSKFNDILEVGPITEDIREKIKPLNLNDWFTQPFD